jgi:hypothetical protein
MQGGQNWGKRKLCLPWIKNGGTNLRSTVVVVLIVSFFLRLVLGGFNLTTMSSSSNHMS